MLSMLSGKQAAGQIDEAWASFATLTWPFPGKTSAVDQKSLTQSEFPEKAALLRSYVYPRQDPPHDLPDACHQVD